MTDRGSLIATVAAVWIGGLFGACLAWFTVDWPDPPTLVPRILGWALFVSLGVAGGYCVRSAS